ncbi:DUF456 domain-containing protein [Alkalihalobacillus trypoxylicola]|uniref:DUF456 domain-containing protein n=1 Tax=Alkalihalobacillus trypoxylicola TaxID=519424 RepID=A0A161PBU4_9BACI|nr:DUF456 domain-containing protein [Alkalihalobacillus trypoxylicola]KYG29269.1 hypothetical protein AZF04_07010 [Alkalihalobacillus trypoxylicola]
MDVIWWIIIIALFITSFIGLLFPIIPSVLVIWLGFVIYIWGVGTAGDLSVWFWSAMVLFTVLLFLADLIASLYFVKKYGGSKWGERMAAIGVIVGSFIIPPFGIVVIPFILVFITELFNDRDTSQALKVAIASLFAFLSGTVAKGIIQIIMIIWFIIEVI